MVGWIIRVFFWVGELVKFSEESAKKRSKMSLGTEGNAGKGFVGKHYEGWDGEGVPPPFDANNPSEKKLVEIYHQRELTEFLQESVSMKLNQKLNQTEFLRKKRANLQNGQTKFSANFSVWMETSEYHRTWSTMRLYEFMCWCTSRDTSVPCRCICAYVTSV